VTSYGAPALDALLSGAAAPPPQGARYDVAFEGPVTGRLRGTVKGIDYLHIRPDGRGQLHIHGEITTEDGKKIALSADGVAMGQPPVLQLRENVTLTTSHPETRGSTRSRSGGSELSISRREKSESRDTPPDRAAQRVRSF